MSGAIYVRCEAIRLLLAYPESRTTSDGGSGVREGSGYLDIPKSKTVLVD